MDDRSEAEFGMNSSMKTTDDHPRDRNRGCYYSTIFNSACSVERDEKNGGLVKICERTKRVLRRCPGRPDEILESRTEKTTEDAGPTSTSYLFDKNRIEIPCFRPSQFQDSFGLGRGDKDPVLREFFHRKSEGCAGSLDELVQAAEDVVRNVFESFGMDQADPRGQPSDAKVEHPSGWFWGGIRGDWKEKPSSDQSNSRQVDSQKLVEISGLTDKIREV